MGERKVRMSQCEKDGSLSGKLKKEKNNRRIGQPETTY